MLLFWGYFGGNYGYRNIMKIIGGIIGEIIGGR
jgi:hypothetical protein